MAELRSLVIVLGDQLDLEASALDGFDPRCDAVWMAEVAQESTHVWSSQPRIVLFLAAMRHFAQALRAAGVPAALVAPVSARLAFAPRPVDADVLAAWADRLAGPQGAGAAAAVWASPQLVPPDAVLHSVPA